MKRLRFFASYTQGVKGQGVDFPIEIPYLAWCHMSVWAVFHSFYLSSTPLCCLPFQPLVSFLSMFGYSALCLTCLKFQNQPLCCWIGKAVCIPVIPHGPQSYSPFSPYSMPRGLQLLRCQCSFTSLENLLSSSDPDHL